MRHKPLLLTVVILLSNLHCYGQKEAANWFFGYSSGFHFSNSEAIPLTESSLKAVEGSAAISDRISGNLLFYTDGRNFWNSEHSLMPSSILLPTNCATGITQPAIIIPDSNFEYLYHTFCVRPVPGFTQGVEPNCFFTRTEDIGEGLSLIYYLVDMRLDGGRGDIVLEKSNLVLRADVTEKLTAVPHANGKDYWVITHGWNNNRFYAYPLTTEGVLSPVTTDIGSVHGEHNYETDIYQELSGQIKPSPDGRKIACAVGLENRSFDVFDFDATTGILSNYINLGNVLGQYGVSFSPDNSKLYVTSDGREPESGDRSIIIQFDLHAGTPLDIVRSRMSIISNNPKTNIPASGVFDGFDLVKKGMALGIDGRLYIAGNSDYNASSNAPHVMVVIDKPNERGFDCDINQRAFDFKNGRVTIGLPNFMQHYFRNIQSASVCRENSSIEIFPNPTDGLITIRLPDGCDTTMIFRIINSLGQQVLLGTTPTMDLGTLSSGIYYCIIKTTYHKRIVKRIVKI